VVRIKKKTEELLEQIAIFLLIIFGIFILYQILRVLLGGSWQVDDIILALLIFNLGAIFTIGLMTATLKSNHKNLSNKFNSLANDFKQHLKNHK